MPFVRGGGAGGGGGGLTLGPPTNTFNGANRAAAEAARDVYAGANAAWLAQYDAEPTFTITLTWPVVPANTVYQSRRSSAWADVTGLVRGPRGIAGTLGSQGRFVVYAYINAAAAPGAAPVGGTFERSTGTLVVPAGYTAIPATPAAGSETYRTEAVVNPRTDPDLVNLVWALPAPLPAYAAAALAIDAQEAAETARDLAQQYAGQAQDIPAGSPRGALVATSPTLPTAATGTNSVIAFGAAELWTIEADAPDGFEAGPAANNERLYLPDIHPAGCIGIWEVIEVDGVEVAEIFISHGGVQGATGADRRLVLPVSVTADALVRTGFWPRSAAVASYIQITGNSDTLPADTVVKIYLAVVRGAPGGGPGGGGQTQAQVDARIAPWARVAPVGTVPDASIPAAIMRDAEFTAASVLALLGLTAAELDDLFTGATISGRVITYTQADGTDTTITLPADADTQDGVVETGEIDAAGTELTLTLDTGGTVVVDIPAVLRTGAGAADGVVDGGSYDAATGELTLTRTVGVDIVITGFLGASGDDHTRRGAISTDVTLDQAEYDASTTSTDQDVTIPTWTQGNRYIFLGVPEDEDDITNIHQSGISEFSSWQRVPGELFGHKWWRRTAIASVFNSGRTYTIIQ